MTGSSPQLFQKVRISIISLTLFLVACSIQIPNIQIQGERDPMEKELIGDFKQVTPFSRPLSAFPAIETAADSAFEAVVYQALIIRARLQDEIANLKKEGFVGESRTGRLEILFTAKSAEDSLQLRDLERLVATENQSREAILRFWYQFGGLPKTYSQDSLRVRFFRLQVNRSPKGTLIQKQDGSWGKK